MRYCQGMRQVDKSRPMFYSFMGKKILVFKMRRVPPRGRKSKVGGGEKSTATQLYTPLDKSEGSLLSLLSRENAWLHEEHFKKAVIIVFKPFLEIKGSMTDISVASIFWDQMLSQWRFEISYKVLWNFFFTLWLRVYESASLGEIFDGRASGFAGTEFISLASADSLWSFEPWGKDFNVSFTMNAASFFCTTLRDNIKVASEPELRHSAQILKLDIDIFCMRDTS